MSSVGASPQATQDDALRNVVIRLAGNSQDGIQSVGGMLGRLAGRTAQEVMTYMTIPSTISGGPSIYQVHLGSGEVLHAGDVADEKFPGRDITRTFYVHDELLKGTTSLSFDSKTRSEQIDELKRLKEIVFPKKTPKHDISNVLSKISFK